MKYTPAIKLTLHEQYRKFINNNKDIFLINAEISPSGKCKAGCKWCFYRNNLSNKIIDSNILNKTIKDIFSIGCKAITWSGGGEPTSHPDLASMIEDNQNMHHGMFTNALYPFKINPSYLKWVRITWTPHLKKENIQQYNNIKNLSMVINYDGNDNIILKVLELVENTNINHIDIRPSLGINGNTVNIKIPDIKHPLLNIQNYKFQHANEKHNYKKCYGYHFVPFISECGNVYVCNYMTTDEYKLGSIYNNTMENILKEAPHFFPVVDNCQICCKNHEINTLLNFAKEQIDINFV